MRMTVSESLSFIGSMLMRMMGGLLVIADCVEADDSQRDYLIRQREWYERTQDFMEIGEAVDEVMDI